MNRPPETDSSPAGAPHETRPILWKRHAAVAGVFSFVVLAILLSNHFREGGDDPLDSPEYVALKKELAERPLDDQLKTRIRELDLQLRRDYFRSRRMNKIGAYLLLAGIVFLLVSLGRSRDVPVELPSEPESLDIPDDHGRTEKLGRRGVAVVAILAGLCGIILALPSSCSGVDFAKEMSAGDDEGTGDGAKPSSQFPSAEEIARQWPRFRGPGGSGISPHPLPVESWDGETEDNVVWKVEVPAPGASSPLVWEDRVFLTGADANKEEVFCFDAATGEILWRKKLMVAGSRPEPPKVMEEEDGYAACTGVTDGRRVYILYANGYAGCFDFEGRQIWSRSFASLVNHYGHSSSLAMDGNLVFFQLDQATRDDNKSRVVALEALTGKVAWETPRPVDASWASPIVAPVASGPQLVLSATPWVMAYEPASGREIWRAECLEGEVAPSPVYASGLVYAVHSDAMLNAIRPDGKGNVTDTHIVWTAENNLPNTTSPVANADIVLLLETYGYVTRYEAEDGEMAWEHEIEASFYSSPTLIGDRLLVTSQKGVSHLLQVGDEPKELSSAKLGEGVITTPAFAPERIYIRGEKHLFAIGKKDASETQTK